MKYLIVGAVAGGASTAARLRRLDEHAEIIIFEKGGYISYANCGLPYYIGDVIKDREKLFVQTAPAFSKRFNIDVRVNTTVMAVDSESKIVTAQDLVSGKIYQERYDKLVLAVGAEPVRPAIPGIELAGIFSLRNVQDTDTIKHYISQQQVKQAIVIGAGFVGLEMAENLHALGIRVSIVEMGDQVLAPVDFPMAAIVQQKIRSKGIDLFLKNAVTGFEQQGDQLAVALKDGSHLVTDMVILSIGVKPDMKLALSAGLQTGKGIVVNEFLQTSDPDIYAVGDVIEFNGSNTFLAGPANKQGRICANNLVYGNVQAYKGAVNTAIVKVFELTIGSTGVAAKQLQVAHVVSTTHGVSHAGYYPGAKQMTIQLVFSPADGVLLGAQVVGQDGVDKRLDILSAFVQQKKTVYDLIEFEQAYAPPYSSAKDPVNMAGMVAENILLERLKIYYWDEVLDPVQDVLIDVRLPEEREGRLIPGSVNIPLDEIRDRLAELPKDKQIHIYCEAGLRGYLAQRILLQQGFERVRNLSGGYRLWEICMKER